MRNRISRRSLLGASASALLARNAPAAPPPYLGFTEFRTNLPGGRQPNVSTMRAALARADGTGHRRVGEELSREADTWSQFAGWSPDGRTAILGSGWKSPETARAEEASHGFIFTPEGCRYDMHLLELAGGMLTNLTAVERVSFYNTGLFFWPGKPEQLGFQALIDGNSHPFSMDRNGRNKRDLSRDSREFAYGFSSSPDGKHIAYHKSYQIYLAEADGSNAKRVDTGQGFNFVPQWSPDGEWLLFLAGEHYNCHPHLCRRDGSGVRKLADRGGYRGVVEFLDVPDFHGGSSDVPVWSRDGKYIFYTALVKGAVELMRSTPEGVTEQLTQSEMGTLHYHPTPSPDGQNLAYGSKRSGSRQLYTAKLDASKERRLTSMPEGWGAMWPYWQPSPSRAR